MLPIRLYTDPILSIPCKWVENFDDPSLEILVNEMINTMQQYNGVGLASTQVGDNRSVCILHVEDRTKIMVLVNPRVLRHTKEKSRQVEGCLSTPGISIPIKRYKGVEVEAQNLLGEKVQYRFTDYDCRIFLHEWDHLQGKTIAQSLQNYISVL